MKLTPEEFDNICNNYKGQKRVDILNYFAGKMSKEEEKKFLKGFYTYLFLQCKFSIRKAITDMENVKETKRKCRRGMDNIHYALAETDLNEIIKCNKKIIEANGKTIDILLSTMQQYLNITEFAQLLNANPVIVKKAVADNIKNYGKEPTFKELIFTHKVESHNFKAEFIEDSVDVPCFVGLEYYITSLIESNPEVDKQVTNEMFKIFPELKKCAYVATKDSEGRIINIKKKYEK